MTGDKLKTGVRLKSWLCRPKSSTLKRKKASPPQDSFSRQRFDFVDDISMGKSNKFDYTNRPNSGAKLGQIIGSALQKEAEKVKKDGEKQSQKIRKQSVDSSSTFQEYFNMTHIIDLKAPNKELGDHGVCALVDGLEIALSSGTTQASLALEDLNLSGNGITTLSLARLAPVVALTKYDLKTLNLTDNKIKVETDTEAARWEIFLQAFKDCMKLRRLDLSGNVELGSRALEVLARVHINEEPINPIPPGGESSTLSFDTERNGSSEELPSPPATEFEGLGIGVSPTMADGRLIKRRCGLRSVPYITLHNVGLDDAGALWLSYVLENHYYPNQLIDELNATLSDSHIKTYQQDANFRGLDWHNNKSLGKEGTLLLERTEYVRRQTMLDDRVPMASSLLGDVDSVLGDGESDRRKSGDRRSSRAVDGNRRVSIRSIRTADGGEHEVSELESARKKLNRSIIAQGKVSSVELWRSALQYFRTSRMLLYIAPTERDYYSGPPLFSFSSPARISPTPSQDSTKASSPISSGDGKLTVDIAKAGKYRSDSRASYAAKLAAGTNGTGQPELALTEVTNTPVTLMILQKPTHRKGAFSEGVDLDATTKKLEAVVVRDHNPLRFVKYQQRRLKKVTSDKREFRETSVPCHLPRHIMEYLMTFVVTDRERAVLSNEQRRAALEWGQKRESMKAERDWLKKDESAQVLMLLDGIKCLAYGQ